MRLLISVICILYVLPMMGQLDVSVSIDVSADTIYMNNAFRIQYTCKNGSMDSFKNQEIKDFDLLQGPSRSSQISIINGIRSGEETYTYFYRPQRPGKFKIKGFELTIGDKIYKADPVNIIVIENPDGLHQDPNTGQLEGRPQKKAVRKRYRI